MVNYAFNLSGKQFGYYLVDITNETNWSEITEFEMICGLWNKGKERGVTPIFMFPNCSKYFTQEMISAFTKSQYFFIKLNMKPSGPVAFSPSQAQVAFFYLIN